jgi:hypothetical protein
MAMFFISNVQATELDTVLCSQGAFSYRYEYQAMNIIERVQLSPSVSTGEKRYEQNIVKQTRDYSYNPETGEKTISYKMLLEDGSKSKIKFKLIESKIDPTGFPQFVEGEYSGSFSNGKVVNFDKCSLFVLTLK